MDEYFFPNPQFNFVHEIYKKYIKHVKSELWEPIWKCILWNLVSECSGNTDKREKKIIPLWEPVIEVSIYLLRMCYQFLGAADKWYHGHLICWLDIVNYPFWCNAHLLAGAYCFWFPLDQREFWEWDILDKDNFPSFEYCWGEPLIIYISSQCCIVVL